MDLWLPHASFRQLERELKQLDRNLFLVEQRGVYGETFYEIRYWQGPEAEPPVLVDWREPDGKPKELSFGILEDIRRQMQRGPLDIKAIVARNEELKKRKQDEVQEVYAEMTREFERHMTMGNFGGPVHRSPALVVARRRARRERSH